MQYEQALSILSGTQIGSRLAAINDIYSQLDTAQQNFTNKFCIHCKDGCGSCCQHFNPDITIAEAQYIAMGLIFDGTDQQIQHTLKSASPTQTFCPLYRPDNPFHCSIYHLRPLICRLFGASVIHDKNGDPAIRACKWNPYATMPSPATLKHNPQDLIFMSDYGIQLAELQPEDTSTYPLTEAVDQALSKIRFLMLLSSNPHSQSTAS